MTQTWIYYVTIPEKLDFDNLVITLRKIARYYMKRECLLFDNSSVLIYYDSEDEDSLYRSEMLKDYFEDERLSETIVKKIDLPNPEGYKCFGASTQVEFTKLMHIEEAIGLLETASHVGHTLVLVMANSKMTSRLLNKMSQRDGVNKVDITDGADYDSPAFVHIPFSYCECHK